MHGHGSVLTAGRRGDIVAITGADTGVGAATARSFAASGARLVLGAPSQDRLPTLARELRRLGAQVVYGTSAVDANRRDELTGLVDLARREFGGLDLFVGNVGVGPIASGDELRIETWQAMIDASLHGLMCEIGAALPVFSTQGHGHFIHTSTAAPRSIPGQVVYALARLVACALAEGLGQEAGPGIRVSLISPGCVAADFLGMIPDLGLRRQMAALRDGLSVSPDSIGQAIALAFSSARA